MNKNIEVSEDELKDLTVRLCQLGEQMGKTPDEFVVMLSMCARYLCDAQGIDIQSERKCDA